MEVKVKGAIPKVCLYTELVGMSMKYLYHNYGPTLAGDYCRISADKKRFKSVLLLPCF